PQLPFRRTHAAAAVGRAYVAGIIDHVQRAKHRLLAEEAIVVVLDLRVVALGVVLVELQRAGRIAADRIVEPPDAPACRIVAPGVVAPLGVAVAVADDAGAAKLGGRKPRVGAPSEHDVAYLVVGIGRERLDLGAADLVVGAVVPD